MDQKSFTINLGIASKRIGSYYGDAPDSPPPSYACHWETRIGSLMPDNRDKWWTLSDEPSYCTVEIEVQKAVAELAIPLVKPHSTEQGLFELWVSKMPGYFEYPTLKYKSILLAEQGKFDALPEILLRIREICRGKSAESGAEKHIAELRERFSLAD